MMSEVRSSSIELEERAINSGGGRGRRKPSLREKENNRRRERRRRAIATNIYKGLRSQGNYNLPKHCDNNEVLKALCKDAGWVVLPDGTTFRKEHKLPPSAIETKGTSTNTTPCSSQEISPQSLLLRPIPSYKWSTTQLETKPTPSASLSSLHISNIAPKTPPPPSSFSELSKTSSFNKESLNSLSFTSFVPTTSTQHQEFEPATIPECDESNSDPMMLSPGSPTFNFLNTMDQVYATTDAIMEKGKGVKAWTTERLNEVGCDDLQLSLGNGNAKGF